MLDGGPVNKRDVLNPNAVVIGRIRDARIRFRDRAPSLSFDALGEDPRQYPRRREVLEKAADPRRREVCSSTGPRSTAQADAARQPPCRASVAPAAAPAANPFGAPAAPAFGAAAGTSPFGGATIKASMTQLIAQVFSVMR